MTSGEPLSALPARLREHLADELQVAVSTTLRSVEGADAPGATFFSARIAWGYPLGYAEEADDDRVLAWAATHGVAADDTATLVVPVGHASLTTIPRFAPDGFDQLDSISGDHAALGAALFLGVDGRPAIAENVEGIGGLALLLNDIEIEESFRGIGVSIAAVDMLLSHFEFSCGCAVLEPLDRSAQSDRAQATARRGLSRHWGKLGFENYTDDVMMIDLGLVRPFHPGVGGLRSV